jgi:ABC-type Mn2+/Zn2+ transport system ATPase subunit
MITETMNKNQPLLSFSGVTLGYPGVIALHDIDFEIHPGEFIGIIGPNGSGKSTLLKGVLGLLKPMAGEIVFHGDDFSKLSGLKKHLNLIRRRIGYVPQKNKNDLHFPATVKEVVLMGLYSQIGWFHPVQKIHREKALESLRMVGMAEFCDRPIGELSGGQQQKVMIARALVSSPDLLMLDEPTASIDVYAQNMILETLERLNREQRITILMVSHDINEIVHFCDKILLLNGGFSKFGIPNQVLTKENLKSVYGDRIYVHDHHGHPHILVGDFYE